MLRNCTPTVMTVPDGAIVAEGGAIVAEGGAAQTVEWCVCV